MAFEAAAVPPAALQKQLEAQSPIVSPAAEQSTGIKGKVDSFFQSRNASESSTPQSTDGILGIKTDDPSEVGNVMDYAKAKDSRETTFAARNSQMAREQAMHDALDDTTLAKSYLEQVVDRESKLNGGAGNSIDRHYAELRVHEAYRKRAMNSPEVVAAINSGNQDEIEDTINRTINNTLIAEAKADLANKIASQDSTTAGLSELAQASVPAPTSEAVTTPEPSAEIQDQETVPSLAQGEQEDPAVVVSESSSFSDGEAKQEHPLSEVAVEASLVDSLDEDPRYKALLQEASLTYLQTHDSEWFSERYENADRDEHGYLTDKDGNKFLPYQNIGGGQPMQDVLDKAKAEFERQYPNEAKAYAEKFAAKASIEETTSDSAGAEDGSVDAGQEKDSSSQADSTTQSEVAGESGAVEAGKAESPQVEELRSQIESLQESLKSANETLENVTKEISSLKDANGKLVQAVQQVMAAQDADPETRKKIFKNVGALLAAIVATMGISAVGVGKQIVTPS